MARMILFLQCMMFGLAVASPQITTSSASSQAVLSTQTQSMPAAATQGFNIDLVDNSTLFNWCLAQQHTCPLICLGAASQNQCDPSTLIYACVCPNGTAPDCSAFEQTVLFFMCEENYGQCIDRNPNDVGAQAQCRADQQCGTRNATAELLANPAYTGTYSSTLSSSLSSTHSATSSTKESSLNAASTASPNSSSVASSESSSTSSASSATSTPSSSLSSGAYAGIGVGATLAALAVAAIAYFLFKRQRRNLRNKRTIPQSRDQPVISPQDPHGKTELQGDSGKKYGFMSTIQPKPEMQTPSNRHEADSTMTFPMSARPLTTNGRHELHENYVSYQRNEESDTTAYDEKNESDVQWGGGPGAASDCWSER